MSGIGKIGAFVQRLESLATPEVRAKLSQKLGGVMIRLIDEQIDRGIDAYGNPMKPRSDGALPLQGLRGTFSAAFVEGRVRVASRKWYSLVHQHGWTISAKNAPLLRFRLPSGAWASKRTVTIPQRMLVPTEDLGLGDRWAPPLMEASERFMRDHLQGRG